MAPIRVAIIGLSSLTGETPASSGEGWAASAHLPYLLKSPHYEITALCNSSKQSAKAAVEKYKLPSTTKTYGSPEDLAKDPDVDLVVCCLRVDRHHKAMMPILKAGKGAYVEWPLGANLQQSEDMLGAAKKSGSKTIVGLQARNSPVTLKVKQLVQEGAIGNLLSSEFQKYPGFLGGDTDPPGIDHVSRKEMGSNVFTIPFAHMVDPVLYALGQFEELSAILATRFKQVKLLKLDGSFDKMITRETPDQMMVQGTLRGSGAPMQMYLRGGKQFKNTPAVDWRVYGTKGEIRVTADAFISLAMGEIKVELFDYEKDSVEEVKYEYVEAVKDLPPMAKNIAGLYELFATASRDEQMGKGFVDFEEAVKLHRTLAAMEKSSEEKKVVKVEF